MAGGNIMSRWSGEIHPNGEVALSDPAWAQAISIGKVQLNNKISKMEEVLAWLIPSATKRPQAPHFLFFYFLQAIENAGQGLGERRAKLPSV